MSTWRSWLRGWNLEPKPEGKTELEANSVQADSETPAICGDDKDKTEKVEEKTSSHKVLNNDFMKFPLRMEGKL